MTTLSRADADLLALRFLRDHGPHTLPNPCDTEEAICAALVFLDLERRQLVSRNDFGGGFVQFALTKAGQEVAA